MRWGVARCPCCRSSVVASNSGMVPPDLDWLRPQVFSVPHLTECVKDVALHHPRIIHPYPPPSPALCYTMRERSCSTCGLNDLIAGKQRERGSAPGALHRRNDRDAPPSPRGALRAAPGAAAPPIGAPQGARRSRWPQLLVVGAARGAGACGRRSPRRRRAVTGRCAAWRARSW